MIAGRPRKPSALKIIQGTFRPDRANVNEPAGTPGAPKPPEWLGSRASEIFYEISADMAQLGTLCLEWRSIIADYAAAREEMERFTGILEDLGSTYSVTRQTGDVIHKARPENALRSDAIRRM